MKSLTIKTLAVALTLALLITPSLAVSGELSNLPVSLSEKNTHEATAATSSTALFALNRLDAQTLAEQEMTDQELKAVEGGMVTAVRPTTTYTLDLGLGVMQISVFSNQWPDNSYVLVGSCVMC